MPDLHNIIATGNLPRLIKLAMRGGLHLDTTDANGRTPLHIACINNNVALVKFLFSFDAVDPDVTDKDGKTPLQLTPRSALKDMTLIFSQMESRRLQRRARGDPTNHRNEEKLAEVDVRDSETVSPSTLRKIVICLVAPFLFLIFYNGFVFAGLFVSVSLAFYYISLAYFVAEIAIRPPWYHHKPKSLSLSMNNCPDYWEGWVCDPATDFNLDYEDVCFTSSNGYTLRGWYVPPPAQSTRSIGVVMVHGAGRDRRTWQRHLPFLHDAGYGCLLFDLREHGCSDGNMRGSSFGMYERFDVIAACQFMRGLTSRRYERLCAIGTSMGGSSVIMAAAIDKSIDMVIAENALTTSAALLDQHVTNLFGGYFSKNSYSVFFFNVFRRFCTFWLNVRIGNKPSKHCQALHCIDKISPRPVLLMHGTADTLVPVKHSQALFEAAKEPKELYLCEGAFHCGLYNTQPEDYETEVLKFLAAHDESGETSEVRIRSMSRGSRRLKKTGEQTPVAAAGGEDAAYLKKAQ